MSRVWSGTPCKAADREGKCHLLEELKSAAEQGLFGLNFDRINAWEVSGWWSTVAWLGLASPSFLWWWCPLQVQFPAGAGGLAPSCPPKKDTRLATTKAV